MVASLFSHGVSLFSERCRLLIARGSAAGNCGGPEKAAIHEPEEGGLGLSPSNLEAEETATTAGELCIAAAAREMRKGETQIS